jgi:WD40 repeat protein
MKWLRLFIFFILYTTCCISFAQTQIPNVHADYIKIDPYGNIYAVKEAQLSKFSPQGKLLYSYSKNSLGVISSIDVFNPMKIMLFYQDAGMLVFLNEQLALINEPISLFDANYPTVSLASYSSANQIHLYDNTGKYLVTLDFFMREISKTPINFPAFNPTKMIELEEKSLAFHDPETGIFLFDAFGTFNKLIPIITSHPVTVTPELIYYTNNNEVVFYNYKTLNAETQQLPVSDVVQTLFYRNNMIVLLQTGTIWIYEENKKK